ncbi:MAG: ABC transporter permease [Bacteroidetes bacterium]|nr:ABC transporter permease [Bacteroidota bacterium]
MTAVMEDVPSNSHFRFTFLASMASYQDERHDDWVIWNQYYTYLKLKPGTDVPALEKATFDMLGDYLTEDQLASAGAIIYQPLADIYLRGNMFREIAPMGNGRSVRVFMILGVFILLIAAVNFVNLSTARSSLRAREVGVRKSLGAGRGVLVRQFLVESTLTVVFSAVLAVGFVAWYLDPFNTIAAKAYTFSGLFTPKAMGLSLIVLLGTGLLSGVYPALVLSGFSPTRIFSGAAGSRGSAAFRRILVTTQFAISAALIMGTGVVADQIRFVENRALGFEKEHVVSIPLRDRDLIPQFESIRNEMAMVPGVEHIALAANRPGGSDYGIPIEIPGRTRDDTPGVRMLVADYDFLDVFDMQLASGRGFLRDRSADHESGLLINEELVRQLGWDNPIGQTIHMTGVGRTFEVIGVLKDFHFRSLHEPIFPLILFMAPDEWYSQVVVRLNPQTMQATLDGLAEVHARYDAVNPFSFTFMDETLDTLYAADRRASDLLLRFTVLAVIIACLGLFGLAAFTAERRRAEIGVRKVVGASERQVIWLLTRETAWLVGLSILLALPIVLYFGRDWLSSFAYSGGMDPLTLASSALLVFVLAFATAGIQAWRAARLNPVDAIRTD